MKKTNDAQYELEKDDSGRLVGFRSISTGFTTHFHRNVEIYGVVKGRVRVKIAGEEKILTDGQMAIVNGMELHDYAAFNEAEIFCLHIGSQYLSTYYALYQRSFLPRWLLNVEKNKKITQRIFETLASAREYAPLKKHGAVTCLLSEIIEEYGVRAEKQDAKSYDLVENVIAFIRERYAEEITLKRLAAEFCIEEKTLSKKLSRCIGVDLRVFVNDVRAQAAIRMRQQPSSQGLSLKEIGKLCGFKNQDTFYRVYNRNLAITNGDLSR